MCSFNWEVSLADFKKRIVLMFVFKKMIKIQGERYMFAYISCRADQGSKWLYVHIYAYIYYYPTMCLVCLMFFKVRSRGKQTKYLYLRGYKHKVLHYNCSQSDITASLDTKWFFPGRRWYRQNTLIRVWGRYIGTNLAQDTRTLVREREMESGTCYQTRCWWLH